MKPEQIHCGHGLKRELPHHRGVRMWEMNCGEVRTELSEQDYFGNAAIAKDWIDGEILNLEPKGNWITLDQEAVKRARQRSRQ